MRKLFLIFSLFGLLGCAEEKKKVPADLLPAAKMSSILADIHIAEARVESMRLSPDTAKVIFDRLQVEVLKKHKIAKADFDKTYDFYLNNLPQLDKLYEQLVDTLSMRELKALPPPAKPEKPLDSVQNVPKSDSAKPDTALLRKKRLKYLK